MAKKRITILEERFVTSLLLPFFVFVAIPAEFFVRNKGEVLAADLYRISILLIALLVVCFMGLYMSAIKWRSHISAKLPRAYLAIAIFLMLAGALNPAPTAEILSGDLGSSATLLDIFMDIILLGMCLIAFNKYSKLIMPVGLSFLLTFFLSSLVNIGTLIIEYGPLSTERFVDRTRPQRGTPLPNVYYIVFDGFQSDMFLAALEDLNEKESFDGFIFYGNARSNYLSTKFSFPSFLRGDIYPETGVTIESWYSSGADTIFSDMYKSGYTTSSYGLYPSLGYDAADNVYNAEPIDPFHLLNVLLYGAVPISLRSYVGTSGISNILVRLGFFPQGETGDLRTLRSYRQWLKMAEDERHRTSNNQFVFAHIFPPHPPFQLNRRGEFYPTSDYQEQVYLAVSMMVNWIELLGELGRLEESLIIFHSDHGTLEGFKKRDSEEQIESSWVDPMGYSFSSLNSRFSPLLLVKASQASGSLRQNPQLVELKALRGFLNENIGRTGGEVAFPESAEVVMFHGLKKKRGDDGRTIWGCGEETTGTFVSYRVASDLKFRHGKTHLMSCEK